MRHFKICPDDELVNTLKKVFNANILRIPETRIQPLTILAHTKKGSSYWGNYQELLGLNAGDAKIDIHESKMADIAGKRSKSVSTDLGLEILNGYLNGFGLPAASISSKFSEAKTISFSFQEVNRKYLSPSGLGNIFSKHSIKKNNPSSGIFFNQDAELLLIDSIITSKDFSITVDSSNVKNFSLDIDAIEKIIGEITTDIKVVKSSELGVSFKGNTPLTFAFTCLVCHVDPAGRINFEPASSSVSFKSNQVYNHKQLTDEPHLIELL